MLLLACVTVYKLVLASVIGQAESSLTGNNSTINCTDGTFYSREYKKCIPCSICDNYSTMYASCMATADTVCVTCASQPGLVDHPACKQCPPCEAGEYLVATCTAENSTICHPCPEGSFNELASYRTHCTPCTSCENRIMIRDCNTSLDTECGSCKRGYYKDPNRNTCNRCSSCAPGQAHIQECQNGLRGKLCSEFFFVRTDFVTIPGIDDIDTTTTLEELTSISNLSAPDYLENSTSDNTTVYRTLFPAVLVPVILTIIIILVLKYHARFGRKSFSMLRDEEEAVHYYADNCGHREDDCLSYNDTQ